MALRALESFTMRVILEKPRQIREEKEENIVKWFPLLTGRSPHISYSSIELIHSLTLLKFDYKASVFMCFSLLTFKTILDDLIFARNECDDELETVLFVVL